MSESDDIRINVISEEYTDPKILKDLSQIEQRLIHEGVRIDQVTGSVPIGKTEYISNLAPYCASDSFVYALIALGHSPAEIAQKLNLSTSGGENESRIVNYLHNVVAEKRGEQFLSFPEDVFKINNRLRGSGLISTTSQPANLTDLYFALRDGQKGLLGLPEEKHYICAVGLIQTGTNPLNARVLIVDPQDTFQVENVVHHDDAGAVNIQYRVTPGGNSPLMKSIPFSNIVEYYYSNSVPIPGAVTSNLIK